MKKYWQAVLLMVLSFFTLSCTEQFDCLNCHDPQEAPPNISPTVIKDFAKQGVNLMPTGEYLKIVLPADKFFLTNAPTLKEDKKPALMQVADLLKHYGPEASVRVEGFTDTIADDSSSRQLSLYRAQAVLAYLWSQGLDAEHLYAVGLGKTHLVADPQDVTANAANRRVEIVVHAYCTTCY